MALFKVDLSQGHCALNLSVNLRSSIWSSYLADLSNDTGSGRPGVAVSASNDHQGPQRPGERDEREAIFAFTNEKTGAQRGYYIFHPMVH